MNGLIKKIINQTISFVIWTYRNKVFPIYVNLRVKRLSKNIRVYKDAHRGQTCFIIGNGPSLKPEDLNRIKDIPSFSCNRINLIFDKTEWRPYYYTFSDTKMAGIFFDEAYKMEKKQMFTIVSNSGYSSLRKHFYKDCIFLRSYYDKEPNGNPQYSYDVSKKIMQHGTVTYANIQLASYMGFKKIYLIGVDNAFAVSIQEDGSIKVNEKYVGRNHFDSGYWNGVITDMDKVPADVNSNIQAYTSAKMYCEKIGVDIVNATRGGELEVFPRIDFDTLFDDNGEFIDQGS